MSGRVNVMSTISLSAAGWAASVLDAARFFGRQLVMEGVEQADARLEKRHLLELGFGLFEERIADQLAQTQVQVYFGPTEQFSRARSGSC